ncbi:MAG: RdgB/HAM1 family non-canonical purine NTP pyrophosphatase [Acidimicrobiaceae bacterium]|nr:RdgB/HAM1 family non-canonical purine NTP pyrophosphatase [Acidimicrobiaceae bacterium]MXZ65291.1 RdgB/HAM1 family non-canonical purine NTP pyrophosphatase [Acidimicrobiaceae bacterium]MYF34489.1 RdgB/HAM1 family non-canonical purine NTP pyrophosphatase [Acidimicrobiaceae bacterium]MYG79746.1 RdgB/HAM1 family non-canonical purine NTP pyrophosphatase [Acidimicrobiaceae bacterium]MYJ29612.1 RdgB/HAM1 family non-canonical purine NTP pyrophosphatase [Acidimicrobiaceae bacterium]
MIKLVCASANPDKVAEMAEVLAGHAVLLPRPEGVGDVAEDAEDLTGNARLKAQAVCEFAGAPALADDTGLEVDALGGAPGVHSARYAGPEASYADNLARLMADMRAVPTPQRTARFRSVVMVCFPNGSELAAEGVVEGVITVDPRGSGGFGYDPVFAPAEGGGRTFAEMGASAKNAMSHRARALRALLEILRRGESP